MTLKSADHPKRNPKRLLSLSAFATFGLLFYTSTQYLPFHPPPKSQNKSLVLWESEIFDTSNNATPTRGVLLILCCHYGLGNQLFFFAQSYAISRHLRIPLLLPLPPKSNEEAYRNYSRRDIVIQHFSLPKAVYVNYANIPSNHTTFYFTCQMTQNKSYIPEHAFINETFFQLGQNCFDGSMFAEYAEELKQIRVNLESPSKGYWKWRDLIWEVAWPVAVHVRKGDLIGHYWNPPIEYFQESMRRMKIESPENLKPTFFVFSDEIDWAKDGIIGEGFFLVELGVPVYFVTGSFGGFTNLEELDLMIRCKSIIISSSTYSWWAAFLMKDAKDKIVIRPKFNATRYKNSTASGGQYSIGYPEDWIPMEA